jgi:regulator of protease activity HflC (stomatin/prohibitin superfamily)
MNTSDISYMLGSLVLGLAVFPFFLRLVQRLTVEVQPGHAVLITRFGKLSKTLTRPGPQWMPARVLPWVRAVPVSLGRETRECTHLHVSDVHDIPVIVNLALEFRIADPARALLELTDWERSLHNQVIHSANVVLGKQDSARFLRERAELGALIQHHVAKETASWGIQVEAVHLRDMRPLAEVASQMLETLSSRLERPQVGANDDAPQRVTRMEMEPEPLMPVLAKSS